MDEQARERIICEGLVESWNRDVKPHVVENACVLAARIASEVLSYFGVSHKHIPMMGMTMNDVMFSHQKENRPPSEWDKSAWSVGVGFPNMVATNADLRSGNGFDGHVVIMTPHFYLDLTAYQMSRTIHGIDTDGSILITHDEIDYPFYLNDAFPDRWGYIPIKQGHMLVAANGNMAYMNSPDWKKHYKIQAGQIIRSVRHTLTNKSQKVS